MESCFVFETMGKTLDIRYFGAYTSSDESIQKYRPFENKIVNELRLTNTELDGKLSHCFFSICRVTM